MSNIIAAENVVLGSTAASVEEAFAQIADKSVELGIASNAQDVLSALREREAADSTGMVNGFAIPHAKSDAVAKPSIVALRFASAIDWGKTQDNKPISCAIAVLTPASDPTAHLRILAQVATMIVRDSFCKEALSSDDTDAIAKLIAAGLDD